MNLREPTRSQIWFDFFFWVPATATAKVTAAARSRNPAAAVAAWAFRGGWDIQYIRWQVNPVFGCMTKTQLHGLSPIRKRDASLRRRSERFWLAFEGCVERGVHHKLLRVRLSATEPDVGFGNGNLA